MSSNPGLKSEHPDAAARLGLLRAELAGRGLDGFVVPITDEHMSEYVGSYAQRMAWLTGFQGSAGSTVVLADEAAVFTDGRYTIQVRQQVPGELYDYIGVPASSPAEWLVKHAKPGMKIGYDAWLHSIDWVKATAKALAAKGAELVATEGNPIDAVWKSQPAPSPAEARVHNDEFAGKSVAAKRQEIADWLKENDCDATIVTALDSVAWLFNLRGSDVSHTPVALAYAIVHTDATAELFIAPGKMTDAVRQHLGNSVRIRARDDFEAGLAELKGKTVAADPERAVAAIFEALEAAGATIARHRDPIVFAKAIKNQAEIAGHKAAQARDGAALSKFLRWMEVEAPKGTQTELSAVDRLLAFREETGVLLDTSFDTISGAGPNGALCHYRVDEESNRRIEPGMLYLVDSGGQYADGTTDVTRTIPVGEPSAEMRRRFTQVLKGHIAIATARFPEGITGAQLDGFARQYLWADGVDFAHGTGHGVGSFLAVHEGPQSIAPPGSKPGTGEPLKAGMILSNEPGYYKENGFGIRIENLVLVVPIDVAGAEAQVLGFETLTYAPIERDLIDAALLSDSELAWLNDYHAQTLTILGPQLEGADKAWLEAKCAPL
ncbi:MAG: aminopeptidase P family protein [Sphingomonadales bacterium]|nr:aminopeptidase P family protein [Sphingomonadales bacterium]